MSLSPLKLLLGRPLSNRERDAFRIGPFEAAPTMGLDGLGSPSYGREAVLTILAPLGAASLHLIGPIIGLIVALLAVLYLSYRQTVKAYPDVVGVLCLSAAVPIPELVKPSWWQHLLHNGRAGRLREMLLREGGDRLVVIDVPWRAGGASSARGEGPPRPDQERMS